MFKCRNTLFDTCLFQQDKTQQQRMCFLNRGWERVSGRWADGGDSDFMPRPITAVNWCCKVHLCLAKSIMFSMGTAGQVCYRNMCLERTIVPPAGKKIRKKEKKSRIALNFSSFPTLSTNTIICRIIFAQAYHPHCSHHSTAYNAWQALSTVGFYSHFPSFERY